MRIVLLFVCMCICVRVYSSAQKLQFPLQLSATVQITAHQLSEDQDYPPRYRTFHIAYDYVQKVARADIEAGYEAAKYYIRRYDQKQEFMVRLPPINDCKRSYLGKCSRLHCGEVMPFPDLPNAEYKGVVDIDGSVCSYWRFSDFSDLIHIYMDAKTGAPRRLVQEYVNAQQAIPMLTYDYLNDASKFEVVEPFEDSRKACERHTGGFPYMHVFHYYVRF